MKLDPLDLTWCVRRLPGDIENLLMENPKIVAVAGGYIRALVAHEDVGDIDLFTDSKETAARLTKFLVNKWDCKALETQNAFTVFGAKPCVQFVHRWTYSDPSTIPESFDFTVCAAAFWYDGKSWDSECDQNFYRDLAAKRLVYRNPSREEAVGGSLLRVLKYYSRGYRITLPSLADVLARVSAKVENTRLTRTEEGMAKVILGLLHEVDPNIERPIAYAD